ncbi:cation-translocating P-type ATPase [Flavisolibacter nicotianae]|uniref:cation-translocating P-type ATPase n=1 Tax=Flavisolibacter nicotianae TaxID=2364882 RepID=UPI0013C3FAF3|nr:cation-translocating P-type ATPase [Flavisolibacter nicotianae]
MSGKPFTTSISGLSESAAQQRLLQFGKNVLRLNETKRLLWILRDVVMEPMFLLLAVACLFYFLLGEMSEGFMMVAALIFVSAISVYQEVKSANALAALKELTEPNATVIRDGEKKEIPLQDVVPGDCIVVEEGDKVPADAKVIQLNDLSVNEAILTGEPFPVEKDTVDNNLLYQGTVVNSGRCLAEVVATGSNTELGKLGKSISTYAETKTALQRQVDLFVRRLAGFGIIAFFLIFSINYWHGNSFIASFLYGLTLAMSAIPEEVPVAFSSFMALGAHAISKLGVITRQPQVVENLGAVNVICLDKTGTITVNKMTVDTVFHFPSASLSNRDHLTAEAADVLLYAGLASERSPFDSMEKAIVEAYAATGQALPQWPMVKEYPLQGHPPMMTHVYQTGSGVLATAKGGMERLVAVCKLAAAQKESVMQEAQHMAAKGHRVLGVAMARINSNTFPVHQDDFPWTFIGLLSLNDPPKVYVRDVLQELYGAGITIKLLTGDHLQTAVSVADTIGMDKGKTVFTGDQVLDAGEESLETMVVESNLFTRMFPEAKLRVIKALQKKGDIVAMTGDGVNDGPALKASDIGIALGKEGTEVARQSADLILTDDDLRKITTAIRQGRKIFSNFKKAVRYIVSIHIPIILVAALPVLFGWKYPNIFTPIHVIFLELIMGPTCSIFFEREPAEANIMHVPPRKRDAWLFEKSELLISIIQGLAIAFGVLLLFYSYAGEGNQLTEVRTVVFTTLILSNIILTYVNRSFEQTLATTVKYKNSLALPVFLLSLLFLFLLHFVPPVQQLFGLSPITVTTFFVCLFTALVCTGWLELYKAGRYRLRSRPDHKHAF